MMASHPTLRDPLPGVSAPAQVGADQAVSYIRMLWESAVAVSIAHGGCPIWASLNRTSDAHMHRHGKSIA